MLRVRIDEICKAHQAEIVVANPIPLRKGDVIGLELQAKSDVLLDGQPGKYTVFLKDDATFGAGSFHGAPVEQHLARGRLLEAGQHAHHRGLAAAGWADHGDEIAVIDVVADILDDAEIALGRIEDERDVVEPRALRAHDRSHAATLSCHTSSLALIRRRIVSMINAMQPMQMMPT